MSSPLRFHFSQLDFGFQIKLSNFKNYNGYVSPERAEAFVLLRTKGPAARSEIQEVLLTIPAFLQALQAHR